MLINFLFFVEKCWGSRLLIILDDNYIKREFIVNFLGVVDFYRVRGVEGLIKVDLVRYRREFCLFYFIFELKF